MDDIVINSETDESNMSMLKLVLEIAQKYGLNIKWSKRKFMKIKIDFLGHTIEGGKIWLGKEKDEGYCQLSRTQKYQKHSTTFRIERTL